MNPFFGQISGAPAPRLRQVSGLALGLVARLAPLFDLFKACHCARSRQLPCNDHPWAVHSALQIVSVPTTVCPLAPSASVEVLGWQGDNLLKPEDAMDKLACRGSWASRFASCALRIFGRHGGHVGRSFVSLVSVWFESVKSDK